LALRIGCWSPYSELSGTRGIAGVAARWLLRCLVVLLGDGYGVVHARKGVHSSSTLNNQLRTVPDEGNPTA